MSIASHCEIIPAWPDAQTYDEWREFRTKGVGGSDVATIVGLNKYSSPYQLFKVKRGEIEGFQGNEATDIGTALEPVVAELFAAQTGLALVEWRVTLRSKLNPWMLANVDRFIVEPSDEFPAGKVTTVDSIEEPAGILAIYEGKTGAIASPGSPKAWFKDGESIPDGYALQGTWYAGVTGLDTVRYGALIGGHGLVDRTLQFDPELFDTLAEKCWVFWDNLQRGIPPEPDGSDATEEAIKAAFPSHEPAKIYDGGPELRALWVAHDALKVVERAAIDNRKAARARLANLMGSAEYGYDGEEAVFTFRNNRDTDKFDKEALQRKYPAIYREFVKKVPGARVMKDA